MRFILLFLVFSFLTGCMEIIDLEHLRPERKLVLTSIALAGEPMQATLSTTWFYSDYHPETTVDSGRVELFVNGQSMGMFERKEDTIKGRRSTHFKHSYVPNTGDRIRVTATAPNFPIVEGSTKIPELINLSHATVYESRDSIPGWEDDTYYLNIDAKLKAQFKDPNNEDNHYAVILERGLHFNEYVGEVKDTTLWEPYRVNFGEDPVFAAQVDFLDKFFGNVILENESSRVFSDDLIDGKEYEMNLQATNYISLDSTLEDYYYRMNFLHLSNSYYLYLLSLQMRTDGSIHQDLVNAGLSDPTQIYSNIKNGLGIVGSCARTTNVMDIIVE